jgi:hypothetical protein
VLTWPLLYGTYEFILDVAGKKREHGSLKQGTGLEKSKQRCREKGTQRFAQRHRGNRALKDNFTGMNRLGLSKDSLLVYIGTMY